MNTLSPTHQSVLAQLISLLPDTAKRRLANDFGLNAEQFRHGLATCLAKLVTTIQDREAEPAFQQAVTGLIPALSTPQAIAQLEQVEPVNPTINNGLEQLGHQLLQVCFGQRLGSVADAIAVTCRLSQANTGALLHTAAAVFLAFMGQNQQDLGILPWAVVHRAHQPHHATSPVAATTMAAAPSVPPQAAVPSNKPRRGFAWLLPLLLGIAVIGGLAWGIWTFLKGQQQATNAQSAQTVKYLSVTPIKSVNNQDLGRMMAVQLPNNLTLSIPEKGIEQQLLQFIKAPSVKTDTVTWFNFDRILFDINQSRLKLSSNQQLDNIAAILQAYPKVHVKIGGYTDDTGPKAVNRQLSSRRAVAVMTYLTDMGVDAGRLKAEGYGDDFPVADNATEAGRALNRRIALRVIQK